MNGEPLPLVHGFPVRMLTPGLYGYAGACKWMTEIELTTFADFDAYWVRRGWGARGAGEDRLPDRPARSRSRSSTAGTVTVAGVAWAQGRGIRRWRYASTTASGRRRSCCRCRPSTRGCSGGTTGRADAGAHTLRVRAIDGTGAVQTEDRATPFPDGATGWHAITVTVG